MGYRLKRKESVEHGVRRIACEQLDKAISEGAPGALPPAEAVHQLRKRCKKLRGLARLVRPAFPSYDDENKAYRDIARALSGARDQAVILDAFSDVAGRIDVERSGPYWFDLREALAGAGETRAGVQDEAASQIAAIRDDLFAARDRAQAYRLTEDGFEAVRAGMKKTYKRALKARLAAVDDPSLENLHEWRKRVKYHWYHLRLMQNVWPELIKPRRKAARKLSDLIGDDRDLAMLRQSLCVDALDPHAVKRDQLIDRIDAERAALQKSAWTLGARLLSEEPKALLERLETYWRIWRHPSGVRPDN